MKYNYYWDKELEDGRCNSEVLTDQGFREYNIMSSTEEGKRRTEDRRPMQPVHSSNYKAVTQYKRCRKLHCPSCAPFYESLATFHNDSYENDHFVFLDGSGDDSDGYSPNVLRVNPCQACVHFSTNIVRINGKQKYGCTNLKAIQKYHRMNYSVCEFKSQANYMETNGIVLFELKQKGLLED